MPKRDPLIPVALITGAGRGIGRGIALELAAEGLSVAINYVRDRRAAEEAAVLCRRAAKLPAQQFVPVRADISRRSGRERLLAATLKAFGRIDALVNNAGVAPRLRSDLLDASESSFSHLIRTNLQGPYFLTQAVARHWLKKRPEPALADGFTVIFVTSISAESASLNRGDYCVSKAGLAMAVQLWAARLAPETIRVIELRPGIMATDMTAPARARYGRLIRGGLVPQKRWGTAADVGRAARSILAGQFRYSSGAVIAIDGGLHIRRL